MIAVTPHEMETINALLRQYVPEAQVRAFGSRCNGNHKPYSDLDIAVLAPQKLTFNQLTSLRGAFNACPLPYSVDVLDYNAISEEFRNIINQKYTQWAVSSRQSQQRELSQ